MWVIDFCEDNLKNVSGATEAAAELQERLQNFYTGRDAFPIRFLTQRCIGACRPCHRQSLILRLNDELVLGENHEVVLVQVCQKIMAQDA